MSEALSIAPCAAWPMCLALISIYLEREIGNAIFYATLVIAAFIFSVDWHGPDEL
jgi:hypothetical protein